MADPEPFCALFSYWYYKSDGAFGKVTDALKRAAQRGQPVRVLVDSGAFSADTQGHRITVDEYAGWLRDTVVPEWGPWLVGCLNLDVLRDPVASWTNWSRLRTLGHDTIPVTHMGDGMEVLDRYVDAGSDYVALGAMVGKSMTRKVRWAAHVHKHVLTEHPDVRLHGLGLSSQEMVERLPWWSVDSSSFGSSYRFGRAAVYDKRRRKLVSVSLTNGTVPADVARVLRQDYGVTTDEVLNPGPHNRELLVRLAAQCIMAWQHDLIGLRPVQPPPSRVGYGTAVAFVDTCVEHSVWALGTNIYHAGSGAGTDDFGHSLDGVGTRVHHADTDGKDFATALEGL